MLLRLAISAFLYSKKPPIEDWVKLAMDRQAATGARAIFWLTARAHDAQLIEKQKPILEAAGVADKFEIMRLAKPRASLETTPRRHLLPSLATFCAIT